MFVYNRKFYLFSSSRLGKHSIVSIVVGMTGMSRSYIHSTDPDDMYAQGLKTSSIGSERDPRAEARRESHHLKLHFRTYPSIHTHYS